MKNNFHMLEDAELLEQVKYLQEELLRLKLFADLANTHEGKFILSWINGRISNLHRFYSSIPASSSAAPIYLSGVQAAEAELVAMRERITDAEKYKKELEEQLHYVIELRESRKRPGVGKSARLVPDSIMERKDA
jgi:hypothetical protein